jgi:hypothetical protein
MDNNEGLVVDDRGRIMFYCRHCAGPVSRSDILNQGLRLPDYGEPADDYLDSQLLDGIEHAACIAASKAS